jgi:hypothetical protein
VINRFTQNFGQLPAVLRAEWSFIRQSTRKKQRGKCGGAKCCLGKPPRLLTNLHPTDCVQKHAVRSTCAKVKIGKPTTHILLCPHVLHPADCGKKRAVQCVYEIHCLHKAAACLTLRVFESSIRWRFITSKKRAVCSACAKSRSGSPTAQRAKLSSGVPSSDRLC